MLCWVVFLNSVFGWCVVVLWCGLVWCGVVWCGVWRGVVWYGMVWYGMVWCGVVWCGVLCCNCVVLYCVEMCWVGLCSDVLMQCVVFYKDFITRVDYTCQNFSLYSIETLCRVTFAVS